MPPTITHLTYGLIACLILLFAINFPDLDKLVQPTFWKEKCWRGTYTYVKTCEPMTKSILHDWRLAAIALIFSVGWLLHIMMDLMIR